MLTKMTLLRHGEPQNAHLLLGRTNPQLTAKGFEQMKARCSNAQYNRVITSPLIRCADFATQYSAQNNTPLVIENRLQELDFGEWDGVALAELWQMPTKAFETYWHQPWHHIPPGGESTNALLHRVSQLIHELSIRFTGEHILMITHSGVIRVILSWLLQGLQQGNAHLSRVELQHGASLSIGVFIDDEGTQWPQLIGLNNSP
ncbi:histidine phosphatase family protein [Shewanella livingstonensis]|uniref:Histidine phosphatase family protein n=1 Tax=Shewanella livingstonensis TaxID=150120 RepID=A0A3G8LUX5_9GAMM|nr:histidine phosphatase family protein [Shewanella livingstonensis]AZG73297.1 histidine phosphatase family protein [Shewanella livingstonensis]